MSDPGHLNMNTEMSLANAVSAVAAFFMIFGGIVPYVPQYFEIKRSRNADGFSTLVCFTLLLANVLRIWFWFGHPFEMPLLLQSIIMIVTMLLMVHLCTVVKYQSEIIPDHKPKSFTESSSVPSLEESQLVSRTSSSYITHSGEPLRNGHHIQRRFLDFEWSQFWRWTDFESYLQCLGVISLTTGVFTYFFINNFYFIETLGFLAVFFEAMLGAPQFYRNFHKKSTKGMSLTMVLCWTSGDFFKTVYFIWRDAPKQFYICGMMQVTLDILILLQVYCYKGHVPVLKKAIQ